MWAELHEEGVGRLFYFSGLSEEVVNLFIFPLAVIDLFVIAFAYLALLVPFVPFDFSHADIIPKPL